MGLVSDYVEDGLVPISYKEKREGLAEISDSEILETLNGLLRGATVDSKDDSFMLTGTTVQTILNKTSLKRINQLFKSGGWSVKRYDYNTVIFSERKLIKLSGRLLTNLAYLALNGFTYLVFFLTLDPPKSAPCATLFIGNVLATVVFIALGACIRND